MEVGPGVVRLQFDSQRRPEAGQILVFRHGIRDHGGMFIEGSKRVSLKDVAFRQTSGLGVLSQYSEDLTFQNVEFGPAPGSSRMFAGQDDGLHFSNCKGKILVDRCRFEGLMDDPINIHGTSVPVSKVIDPLTIECRFSHGQSVGLRFGDAGDMVSLIDPETMLSLGTRRIKEVRHVSESVLVVAFRESIPEQVKAGTALENLTWTPSAVIRNSVFGRVRARGLLVTTPKKVVVEDCVFRSSGSAILIAGDANGWFESGAVKDVTIRRNRFENCLTSPYQFCDAVISIHPEVPKAGPQPFHRGVRITDNEFVAFDAPILWAKSCGDLAFQNNRIVASRDFQPWKSDMAGLTFINCERVDVRGNTVPDGFLGKRVEVEGGRPEMVKVQGW
jgi:hypothetical protein